ncbi:TPA: type III-A CRISPR-associated RAMP protein Csm5, partial [Candidatus Micrarchaeota archaeon]|nr:type III-A CRISPR-associated RAMP protein Csm5 [Candidatus Micrarchaeota archaeon]
MITKIDVELRVLTPVHIGTGTVLTEGFDYVCHNGRTYRIDIDRLAEELYTRDPKLTEQLLRIPPGQLLKPEDLRPDSPYIRYVLPGEPSGQQFREAIKDPHDRPYIPGSSLKGALRTIIAWKAWKELGLSFSRIHLGSKSKNAAADLEAEIFGRDPEKGGRSPHHDLMRALRISDSRPQETAALAVYQVRVWTKRGSAVPISVEAIKPGTVFQMEASIDESLFSEWAGQARGFPFEHRSWLEDIGRSAIERAAERLEREFAYWKEAGRKDLPYSLLKRINELKNQSGNGFPLQLGFGTGWEGTTIGAPLKGDPDWPRVYHDYPMGINPRTKRRTPPEKFPASRRVVVNAQGHPSAPLGWVWVNWKEV